MYGLRSGVLNVKHLLNLELQKTMFLLIKTDMKIYLFIYIIGLLIVLFGARLVYYWGRYIWTREIRLKIIFLSLISWAAILAAVFAVISQAIMNKIDIDWQKKVRF